jgi:biotin carboxyl carrier protein
MSLTQTLRRPWFIAAVALTALAVLGVAQRERIRLWWAGPESAAAADDTDHAKDANKLNLSQQARENLRLVVKPVQPQAYWRSIQVPGMIIERPGQGDRAVTTPVAGVVTRILAVPGDTVRPGDALFTLRAVGDALQTAQSELFKTARELEINRQQQERLAPLAKSSAVPQSRLLELEFQQRRLEATLDAARYELIARGISEEQIEGVAQGKFITEITVRAPAASRPAAQDKENQQGVVRTALETDTNPLRPDASANYEIEQLRVQLGEQVESGQVLCHLASHQELLIEGRGFKREAHLLRRATEEAWPIAAEFSEDAGNPWPPLAQPLTIRHLAGVVDPSSQTFPFYIPLANQSVDYSRGERKFRAWRFRPGQRVRLSVPVEKIDNVFVLPEEAIAREGLDTYVFRQSGDDFQRRPVTVVTQDRRHVVVAADGSIGSGQHIAHNAAMQLNRALKAQSASTAGGHGHEGHGHEGHDHAGHSH